MKELAVIRRVEGSNKFFELVEDLVIVDTMGMTWWVLAGFKTDGASIPRLLRPLVKNFGQHLEAAIVHDWLYKTQMRPRWDSDLIFLDLMLMYGVKKWKAHAMYAAVRAGGWIPWNKYRKQD